MFPRTESESTEEFPPMVSKLVNIMFKPMVHVVSTLPCVGLLANTFVPLSQGTLLDEDAALDIAIITTNANNEHDDSHNVNAREFESCYEIGMST